MDKNRKRFFINSLNQTKLLKNIKNNNISIYNYKKYTQDRFEIEINLINSSKFIKYLKTNKIKYKINKNIGLLSHIFSLRFNFGALIALGLFSLFFILISNSVFRVKVEGVSHNMEDEVVSFVSNYVGNGLFNKKQIKLDDLENKISDGFDSVSFVSAIIRGNTIILSIKEKLQNPEVENVGHFAPLLSDYTGYVKSVILVSGTLNVGVGELIKKGEILVFPYIIDSAGEKRDIIAKANIVIRTFVFAEEHHSDVTISTIRTGNKIINNIVRLGSLDIYSNTWPNNFDMFEVVTYEKPLSLNNIIPFKLVRSIFFEVSQIEQVINFQDVKEEKIKKASQNAYSLIPHNAIITNEDTIISQNAGITIVKHIVELEIIMGE